MACTIAAIFVFYSVVIYLIFACQTLKEHTPSKGLSHVLMKKRAGLSLPKYVGAVNLCATSVETIRTTTSMNPALYTSVKTAVLNFVSLRAHRWKIQRFRYQIGSLQ